jgi:hypothetical protein
MLQDLNENKNITKTIVTTAKNKKYIALVKLCIVNTPEHVNASDDILV